MNSNKKAVLEGLLFVVGDDGLTLEQITDILELEMEDAKNIIKNLMEEYLEYQPVREYISIEMKGRS